MKLTSSESQLKLRTTRWAPYLLALALLPGCDDTSGGTKDSSMDDSAGEDDSGDSNADSDGGDEGDGEGSGDAESADTDEDSDEGDSDDSDDSDDAEDSADSEDSDDGDSTESTGGDDDSAGSETDTGETESESGETDDDSSGDTGVDPECIEQCECLEMNCASADDYPFADDAACHAECMSWTDEEMTCFTMWCPMTGDGDQHLCEHAWGGQDLSEC